MYLSVFNELLELIVDIGNKGMDAGLYINNIQIIYIDITYMDVFVVVFGLALFMAFYRLFDVLTNKAKEV